MPTHNGPFKTLLFLTILLSCAPSAATGQIIPIKTVPVATGDQFLIIPSRNLGMGGVSIALVDSLMEPFANPATGRLINRSRLFTGTTFYNVTGDDGSGRTVPIGLQFRSGSWFGGFAAALQSLTPALETFPWMASAYTSPVLPPSQYPKSVNEQPYELPFRNLSPSNRYFFGSIGRTIPGTGLAVGVSASVADLQAVDGVDLLYDGSICTKQHGRSADYRLGMSGDLGDDRRFDVLLLHTRFDMTHDVYYPEVSGGRWSPWWMFPIKTTVKRNLDRSRTSGAHFRYVQPLETEGWNIGYIFTANWKSHPKIPEYELANLPVIPKDPGNSSAYNVGLGLAHSDETITFGFDFVVEPIWTYTWGEAGEETPIEGGGVIPPGGKTIENDFKFVNILFRIGFSADYGIGGYQLGLQLHSISYQLDQFSNMTRRWRHQRESWLEWTPCWGAHLDFGEFQIRYPGRLKLGTGRPGGSLSNWEFWNPMREVGNLVISPSDPGNFLVAPTGAFGLQEEKIITHQISLVIPFGS